ncbi:MAG: hypothetical protein GY801_33490 [bacterium]|nr:hypothetical protein [bacterium]
MKERIAEQEALKAELFTAKFKLARSESASSIFSRVAFEVCPACGSDVKGDRFHPPENCQLCGRPPVENADTASAEMVRQDLTSRIEDLTESLDRHKRAYKRQERLVGELRQEKAALDERLNEELFKYDSAYLSQSREVEQRIATLQERKRGLDRMVKLPEAITKLEEEADRLKGEEEKLKREIETEKKKLTEAEQRIREIEDAYLDALREVGVPGISDKDRIEIRRNTWMPWIIPEEGDVYNFFNAGSGGKKTLLNVCYALAVHRVACIDQLPVRHCFSISFIAI